MIHKFLKSFLHLLRRTKRGTRSVGFFAKGPLPEVLVGPGFFSKCSIFFSKFLKMFHFFLKTSMWQRKGQILKGGMPKKMKFSQNFSKCSIFFSKCSICSQNVPHYFLKFFPLFSQILPLFSQILPFFSQILQFFSQNVPVVSQNIFIPNKHQKKIKISWANPEGRGLLRAAEN